MLCACWLCCVCVCLPCICVCCVCALYLCVCVCVVRVVFVCCVRVVCAVCVLCAWCVCCVQCDVCACVICGCVCVYSFYDLERKKGGHSRQQQRQPCQVQGQSMERKRGFLNHPPQQSIISRLTERAAAATHSSDSRNSCRGIEGGERVDEKAPQQRTAATPTAALMFLND